MPWWPVSSFPALKRKLGMDREPRIRRAVRMSSAVRRERIKAHRGQGPWVPGVAEAARSRPHCPGTGLSTEPWCCSAYTSPCQSEQTEDPTATKAGETRWEQVGQDLLLNGPPQTCHGVQNPVRVLSLLCWKKWKAPSLPLIPFFIWRSKGRLFLYSQHSWHQVYKFFSWNNSSVLCGIQPGVPQLNSFWR